LKKRELISARLGDVLSSIYLASTVLKHFENQGRRATDLPLVEWSVRTLMYQAQEALHAFLRNLPNRWAAYSYFHAAERIRHRPMKSLARSSS
jgi:acyl-CoA dehydrogenase